MTESLIVSPPSAPIAIGLKLPVSKSISNRALIMASLCGSRNAIKEVSDSDDSIRLDRSLATWPYEMDCGAGGTTLRFLLARCAIREGEEHILTGIPRLLERPHGELVDALVSIGGQVERIPQGFRVRGKKLKGGHIHMNGSISSQFISALLMIAPYTQQGIQIEWQGEITSAPYVAMTVQLMQQYGAHVVMESDRITVEPGGYSMEQLVIPYDRSAAAFWYEIAALSRAAQIELVGEDDGGGQGDAIAAELWQHWVLTRRERSGTILSHREPTVRHKEFHFDLGRTPDLFQPLAITCAAAGATAVYTGLGTLPLKETDRIVATQKILRSFGGDILARPNDHWIGPIDLRERRTSRPALIDPQGDHRMAMAAAPLCIIAGPLRILQSAVVAKSYPQFWRDLELAGFSIEY